MLKFVGPICVITDKTRSVICIFELELLCQCSSFHFHELAPAVVKGILKFHVATILHFIDETIFMKQ